MKYDTGSRGVNVGIIMSDLFLTSLTHLISFTYSCSTTIDKLMNRVKRAVKRSSGC